MRGSTGRIARAGVARGAKRVVEPGVELGKTKSTTGGDGSMEQSRPDRLGFQKGKTDSQKTVLSEMSSFCQTGSQKDHPL